MAVILLSMLSAAALTAVFLLDMNETPISYAAYLLSAYSLLALVIWTVEARGRLSARLWARGDYRRIREDGLLRARLTLTFSLAVNVVYAVLKAALGAIMRSAWLGAFAFYYLCLAAMRAWILRSLEKREEAAEQWKLYRGTGAALLLLTLGVGGIAALAVAKRGTPSYPGFTIYAMAAYAFYAIYAAIKNLALSRRLQSPALLAGRWIGLATALVSMFLLQTALLDRFDGESSFQLLMNKLTGGVVTLLILGIASFMIAHGHRACRKTE